MIGNFFKSGIKYGLKFLNSAIGQKIAEEGIKNVPNIYSTGVNKISNKKIKRVLESNLADFAVKRAQKEIYNWQIGISNFQIENTIKEINDEDLSNNFFVLFPSNKMTKFIDYKQLINQKTGKYPFLISNTDGSTNGGEHWWTIINIEPK